MGAGAEMAKEGGAVGLAVFAGPDETVALAPSDNQQNFQTRRAVTSLGYEAGSATGVWLIHWAKQMQMVIKDQRGASWMPVLIREIDTK